MKKESTTAREAFFLDFAKAIRNEFPNLPLLVTGGFRSRKVMEGALSGNALDIVGMARPAVLNASAASNTLLDMRKKDDEARAIAVSVPTPWLLKKIGNYVIGAGYETVCYLVLQVDKELTISFRRGMGGRLRRWGESEKTRINVRCLRRILVIISSRE